MKYRYKLVVAVIFAVIFAAFCYWQAPGSRLTSAEIDDYLARIDAGKIWYYPVRTASPRIMPCRAAWSRVASSLTTRVPARL